MAHWSVVLAVKLPCGLLVGPETVIVMDAVALAPPESVACAEMVCVPGINVVVDTLAPVPIGPLRLEYQRIEESILPSCGSSAVPDRVTFAPYAKVE